MHKKHSTELKMKVAMEAIRGRLTTSEIASEFQVHPCQVSQWKRQALEALPGAFGNENSQGQARAVREQEDLIDQLYQEIGRLKMEVDWLQKKGDPNRSSRNGR